SAKVLTPVFASPDILKSISRGPLSRPNISRYIGLKPLMSVNRYPTLAEPWVLNPPKLIGAASAFVGGSCALSIPDIPRRPASSNTRVVLIAPPVSSQQSRIQVRTVYSRMTTRALAAGLETQPAMRYSRLIVVSGVALQTKLAAFAPHQQHAVGAAVRCVARGATFHLHRRVFINVRTTLLGMAVHATLKIRFIKAGVVLRSVRIVAVAALDQTLRHTMMHRQRKLRLHRSMAVKAQRRFRLFQQAALQPADFIRKLWHLEKVALWRTEITFALVFDFGHQMRSVALIARQSVRLMSRMLKKILLLAADMAKHAAGR